MRRNRLIPLVAFASCAGVACFLFYRFPDYDIRILGAGYQRYFAFRSAAVPLLFLIFLHGKRSLTELSFILMSVALGAGLAFGFHLLIDSFEYEDVIFPLVGSLIDGTFVDDRLWLIGNSVVSFVSAYVFYFRLRKAWKQ